MSPSIETRELERLVGAVIAPEWRVGGPRPSAAYLRRFPPLWVIAFGRSLETRATQAGLAGELAELRAFAAREQLPRPAVCCDLEEGAGLHFPEAPQLPPALALAAADAGGHARALELAGERTARDARALGVELVLAPVVDVNTRRDNPIIATRSFGDDPHAVARRARAWLEGLARGGALGCLKHFPGHGDTEQDSHTVLPLVAKTRAEFDATELAPYRALLGPSADARPRALGAVMVAHLDVPALTGAAGEPTSLSRRAVGELLRAELGFDGAVLTDGLAMGALAHLDDVHARAIRAGCDLLLGPPSAQRAATELCAAVRRGELSVDALAAAGERLRVLAARASAEAAPGPAPGHAPGPAHDVDALADASLVVGPGGWDLGPAALEVVHGANADALQRLELLQRAAPSGAAPSATILAAACVVGCGRGRAGLDAAVERELLHRIDRELERRGRAGLVWFGSPQVLPDGLWGRPGLALVVCHAPSPPQQLAVARALAQGFRAASGRLPVAQPGGWAGCSEPRPS
jgi:beta-glucosidase-like glycosyl hydrolase